MLLFVWELAVGLSLFGLGFGALRLLRLKGRSTALAGSVGVACLLFLGGWLNMAALIRCEVFYGVVGLGLIGLLAEFIFRRQSFFAPMNRRLRKSDAVIVCLALFVLGLFALGALRRVVWNNDDVSGYIPLAIKSFQGHSLSRDPFSDRRVTSSVGGAIFLDAFMYATGSLHAMPFIDSVYGLILYAWSVWTLGRLWQVRARHLGWVLLCVPVATLMKVNLTIVYLAAAGFFAVLLLFGESEDEGRFDWREALVLGGIMGGLATVKSTNLVFLFLFVALAALLYKYFQPGSKVLVSVAASYGVAALLMLPWCLCQHRTEGTYLYPLLGKGYYANAYGFLPSLISARFVERALVISAPMCLFSLLAFLLAWRLTAGWAARLRAPVLGYLAASSVAIPITAVGLAGDSVDRYIAPFAMPSLLLLLMIVLAPVKGSAAVNGSSRMGTSQRAAALLLGVAGLYVVFFLGSFLGWYSVERRTLDEAFGLQPRQIMSYERLLDAPRLEEIEERARSMQATLPVGATAMASLAYAFPLDFQRNRIYLADVPGMAGLPPGMPIDQGATALLNYLRRQGIQYLIYDRSIDDPTAQWSRYRSELMPRYNWAGYILHTGFAHHTQPLGVIQRFVTEQIGEQVQQIAASRPVLYDDSNIVVISLR